MGINMAFRWKLFFGDLIENVFTEPVICWQGRMRKSPLVCHADADHYFFGSKIVDRGKRVNIF